ncbi:MAG: MoaD/ThiS family protein [Planctomycetota bacterium]
MQLTVLLFGPQAKLADAKSVQVNLGERATAADVLAALEGACPALDDSIRTSRLAINHEFAADDALVTEGDELALIGMVSGG